LNSPPKVNIAEMGQSNVVADHHFEGTNEVEALFSSVGFRATHNTHYGWLKRSNTHCPQKITFVLPAMPVETSMSVSFSAA
jgi:hypothetical protein